MDFCVQSLEFVSKTRIYSFSQVDVACYSVTFLQYLVLVDSNMNNNKRIDQSRVNL